MKILFDHQIFTISRYGGASRYFYEMIKRLPGFEDTDVSVYMGSFINEYGLEEYKNHFNSFYGKKHKDYKYSKPFYLLYNNIKFRPFYRKVNPDIYHQTYYENLCINKKAKRIVTVLDMMHELFPESFSRLDNSSLNKKIAVKYADGIISISHSTKNDLVKMLGIPEEKIRVIHLGNSLNEVPEGEPLAEPPYLLYVAKRGGYKNFEMLVKVFAKLKKNYPELKIICSGGGGFTPEENNLFDSLNVRKDIIQINASDKMLANLYTHAEAFVYPSKYEGFGVSLLEAMNLKCPVIASNLSSIPEILGDAGLYINPDEPEDLEKKIEMLLNDRNLRLELINKGLKQKDNFSWDRTAEQTIEYYREIINK